MLPEGYCFSAKVIIIMLFPLQNYVTMLRRKFKYKKIIKSNNSKNTKGSHGSCALHTSSMRSIHVCNFKLIAPIV